MNEPMRFIAYEPVTASNAVRTPRSAGSLREPFVPTYSGGSQAAQLLQRLFRNYEGKLNVRLWDGTALQLGKEAVDMGVSTFTLVFNNPIAVCLMVLGRDDLRLAEAYFRGDIDIEGDFFAALAIKDHLRTIRLTAMDRGTAFFLALRLWMLNDAGFTDCPLQTKAVKAHSKAENRKAIQFHYDVSNPFYALWLGDAMVYSCAYFERPDDSLEAAQFAKLDHICRQLKLSAGERFLDIGCGGGALVMHAAKHYGVQAHGVTLSAQQLQLAQQRIIGAGLCDQVTVELRDYRDLEGNGVYDKVSSVGMFEHVGVKNLPVYFATVHRLLKHKGLFLNHGITHDVEDWEQTLSTEFINRYIFPDGELDTVSNIQRGMERARFEIADVEALRPHYARALRHWVARLEAQYAAAVAVVSESTYRVWRVYMATCALEFETGEIGVYQVLASKRATGASALPLTRQHLNRQEPVAVARIFSACP